MANLIDYLKWRGDILMEDYPFNEADNLFLNDVTYAHMEEYVGPEETITLGEASERYLKGDNDPDFTLGVASIENVGISERFKKIVLHDLEVKMDPGCQFGAVIYELPENISYIVFRGTDESIEGWREDFETSYHETAGQTLACAYLEKHIKAGKRYIVGGHSKGGNLSVYAAMQLSPEKQDLIETVYNFDGPGIADEMLNQEGYDRIKGKIVKYVPEYSIVGQLFKMDTEEIVIKSDAKGIMQHDSAKWEIMRDGLVKAESLDKDCVLTNKIFGDWIASATMKEREAFTKEFFDQLRVDGDITMLDIKDHPVSEVMGMVGGLFKFGPDAKSAFKKLAASAAKNTASIPGGKIADTVGWVSKVATKAGNSVWDKAKGMFTQPTKEFLDKNASDENIDGYMKSMDIF